MRVCASVDITYEQGDYGNDVESIEAICSRCNNSTTSFGIGQASERRSLVLLRESCPNGESNFYISCSDSSSGF